MEKYTLFVVLPSGDKYLVDNSDGKTIAVFPSNKSKGWDKYLREHEDVRESYRLKYTMSVEQQIIGEEK